MWRAIIRELKARRKGLRLGTSWWLFPRSCALWRTWWKVGGYYKKRPVVLKPVSSDTCFMQSVNPMLKTSSSVGVPGSKSELMGVRSQNRKITRLDEDEKLAELISVTTRKRLGSLWGGGLWRAWGVIRPLWGCVASTLGRISLWWCLLRLFWQKAFDCWFWKVSRSSGSLSGKPEQENK